MEKNTLKEFISWLKTKRYNTSGLVKFKIDIKNDIKNKNYLKNKSGINFFNRDVKVFCGLAGKGLTKQIEIIFIDNCSVINDEFITDIKNLIKFVGGENKARMFVGEKGLTNGGAVD